MLEVPVAQWLRNPLVCPAVHICNKCTIKIPIRVCIYMHIPLNSTEASTCPNPVACLFRTALALSSVYSVFRAATPYNIVRKTPSALYYNAECASNIVTTRRVSLTCRKDNDGVYFILKSDRSLKKSTTLFNYSC